jgi:Flp pilus assembly pilin Flp
MDSEVVSPVPPSSGVYISEEPTVVNVLKCLVWNEQGQDLIEYALLATFVSLLAIVGAGLLGTALNNWYNKVADNINTASSKVS